MPPDPAAFAGAVVLTGPTGSGKTALAVDLAAELGAEVIAADSMTVYRGLDIGTAKPTAAERAAVRHHLLDELDVWEPAGVAWWLGRAAAAAADVRARGKRVLVVGGTPFYLKAMLYGLFDAPPADPAVRAGLEAEAAERGPAALHARLAGVDPAAAARLHPNDTRRVVRALEVFATTGRPISELQATWAGPAAAIPVAVLDRPRAELHARTDARVDAMLAAGWAAEAARVFAGPRPPGRAAGQALGYRELAAVARGELALDEARRLIQAGTRQLAKRQLTFLRGLPTAAWVPAGAGAAARVRACWEVA